MIRARRRTGAATWPGFVDAMTGLLLVLMFVLTIFTVVQFTLRDQISGQQSRLDALGAEVDELADALGLSQGREAALAADLDAAADARDAQAALVAALTRERDEGARALADAGARITAFEAEVAGLLADREAGQARVAALEAEGAELAEEADALSLALATAREETSAEAEQARLAAARADALDALVRSLNNDTAEGGEALAEAEQARLADAAAAEALRARLQDAGAELSAMTLALEEDRAEAEETLTLLAAAEAARDDLDAALADTTAARDEARAETEAARAEAAARLTEAEREAGLRAAADAALSQEEALSAESRREAAALAAQVAALRAQVSELGGLLDLAEAADVEAGVRIEALGADLNTALARVASEERARAEAEAARAEAESQRAALEAERATNLEAYRSDFFGEVRAAVEGTEGIEVRGDRFVFSSEVLFPPAAATLSPEGRAQVAEVARLLRDVSDDIPETIEWIIRVDGHTDDLPLSGLGIYGDNWELSQARALSVVREMEAQGIPPQRLAANGFGEFQPLDTSGTPEARARNRRIEIKLTER